MVSGKARKQGLRRRREYEITPKGLDELRAWIGPPMGEVAVSVAYDPLRSRARFLGALSGPDRRAWNDAAERTLDEVEHKVRRWAETIQGKDPYLELVTRQGELELAARRAWLRDVRRVVEREAQGD